MALILDGRIVRDSIVEKLTKDIEKLGFKPTLAIIQVGDIKESTAYINQKKIFAEKIGADVLHVTYPKDVSESVLLSKIGELNKDKNVHGIIVQIPLPKQLDKDKIINVIAPHKDVDGLTAYNVKKLWTERVGIIPATARGVLSLLEYYKIPVKARKIAVIGRSALVGKPIAMALLQKDATVTMAHKLTKNLPEIACDSEILIVAAGAPRLVKKEWTNKDQVIIDVGITVEELPSRKLVGDVDFENVKDHVKAVSPVPGGVGPMTVASLFQNLVEATQNQ
ncbi:bifunctional 5,10-methylenetetrahydrofolate dehydrogenase/5,10-methenyltetrahydrofolate cyclohydrolase [Candidatus Parcubacteria bacterium]|nr:bifunctional 5,10-methylenetetrahydrofolate dehydrogenase/5,10-methenyltetrahydrofolate cyclohydrolase [Candidatus Parcubacteria bacterium]